ncbi:MAG: hypothetical protein EPN23_04355 [Verrucomicrobia bacterium]|nr:MAG: hypothetical protein EPN23_04355 [Verrucomicrobiota bacterium]
MKTAKHILMATLGLSLVFSSSCALWETSSTHGMWEATNPHVRVWVSATEVTEQQLIAKKIPYYKSTGVLGTGYLIPKSTARQLGDYTIRILATPVLVTVDAATIVTVIGVVALAEAGYSGTFHR